MNSLSTTYSNQDLHALNHDFFGKKARARREARRDDRHAKRMERINAGGGLANTVKSVASSVTSIFGGGSSAPMAPAMDRGMSIDFDTNSGPTQEEIDAQKTKRMTAIIVVVFIVVVGAFVISKMKKKKAK